MIRVPIRVPGGEYEVAVGEGLLARAGEVLPAIPGAERAFVVADREVADLYLAALAGSLPWPAVHLPIPAGEEGKTLGTAEVLYQQLATQEAHRHDVVCALGGGAAGDLAGFVAATYMRGVPFLQIPTTLLAQVDAAIGGKTAVNLPRGKNLVGAFHQPVGVLADVGTLMTLPDREFRSGLAEVAKVGFVSDPAILDLLEGSLREVLARDAAVLADLVARCVRAKAAIVEADEREAGARAILNYGHTLGHALERIEGFGEMTHGEAVATGMVFAARLGELKGLTGGDVVGRHLRVLAALGLPHGGEAPHPEAVLEAIRLDKKYRDGVRFVLLEDLGRPVVRDDVTDTEVREALARLAGEAR